MKYCKRHGQGTRSFVTYHMLQKVKVQFYVLTKQWIMDGFPEKSDKNLGLNFGPRIEANKKNLRTGGLLIHG